MVGWMFPLIAVNDRVNMVRIYENRLPAPAFEGVKELIKKALVNDDWAELTRRIPTL